MDFGMWDWEIEDKGPDGIPNISWHEQCKDQIGQEFKCMATSSLFKLLQAFCPNQFECAYFKAKSFRLCIDCVSWNGPGVEVDHAHCLDRRSPHPTTSKNGDKKHDTCLYWQSNNQPRQTAKKRG